MPTGNLLKSNPAFTSDGTGVLFLGADEQDLSRSDVYLASESGAPVRLTDQAGHKANVVVGAQWHGLTYSVAQTTPFRLLGTGQAAGPGQAAGAGAAVAADGAPEAERARDGPVARRRRRRLRPRRQAACRLARIHAAAAVAAAPPDVRRRRPRGEDDPHRDRQRRDDLRRRAARSPGSIATATSAS